MKTTHYPDLAANPDFAKLEEETLKFWQETKAFEHSVADRPEQKPDGSSNHYVFYDGPPFANGLPHYGHLLTGFVKDAIARYHTMKGQRVERRFGWDCHGLPAEMGAEKELGISGRVAINEYGIGKFNDYCRTSVMKYTQEWESYVTRQGRWVDFQNDYKTLDTNFMESVLWAFKQLYEKGLVYESFRVMPYSWAAETPLSNFETRMDNATREREDKAAYVKFRLQEKPPGAPGAENYYLIAWTTTPWTLPCNLALAVNGGMDYRCTLMGEDCLITSSLSTAVIPAKAGIHGEEEMDSSFRWNDVKGAALVGLTYEPLFPYFAGTPNAFRVLDGSDFVTDGDGTGIVHMAPGFGEVDQKCCAENGIAVMVPVDEKGRYTDAIYDLGQIDATHSRSPLAGEPNRQSGDLVGGKQEALTEFARQMRKEPTPWEQKLWAQLKGDALEGYKFRRQESVDHYIVDFINYEKRLIVELDGSQHAELDYDKIRDAYLQGQGFTVLRFWNNQVDENLEGVLTLIAEALKHAPHRNAQTHFDSPAGGEYHRGAASGLSALRLRGLNVIAETAAYGDDDKAKNIAEKDVAKFGLANMRILRWLKAHGALVKDEVIKHNYPHCWRTDTPVIYRAMSSWYVAVTKFRDRAVALNREINWIPEHVRDGQMGHMLATAPDWSISRNRFWGTPIPIWRSNNPNSKAPLKVFGSIGELEDFFGVKVTDLHRPFIDELRAPDGDGFEYTRVEDVFDCWFESGSMPFAQLHYPFENKAQFEENFPADFITEYIGQTRGWFNTLIMLSTALFDKAPFKNCICHGVVIDAESGLKYSKRLKNYRDPREVMDVYGADALRWMMLSSPVMRAADLAVDPDGKFIRDVVRLTIKPLWSAYNFFTLYANADGVKAKEITASENLLDRYILAKARAAVAQVKTSMDGYETTGATDAITGFFDVLNNWYIRRSRPRFWGEEMTADKQAAYDTLFTVLNLMVRASAPLLPFTTEVIYQGLNACPPTVALKSASTPPQGGNTHHAMPVDVSLAAGLGSRSPLAGEPNLLADLVGGNASSIHLTDFPDVSGIDSAAELVADMDRVRDACTAMGAIRSTQNIRNRQPLASATLYGVGASRLKPFSGLMEDELNVKEIRFADTLEGVAEYALTIHFPIAGKRLGAKMKAVGAAAKAGQWSNENGVITVGGERMEAGEYNLLLKPLISGAQALSGNDAVVVLDLNITLELEAEGRARDLVRMIQQARKDSGLHVADRITLALDVPAEFDTAIATHGDYIREQTLANTLSQGSAAAAMKVTQELDGAQFIIGLSKVA